MENFTQNKPLRGILGQDLPVLLFQDENEDPEIQEDLKVQEKCMKIKNHATLRKIRINPL